jgi:hypothetical protein
MQIVDKLAFFFVFIRKPQRSESPFILIDTQKKNTKIPDEIAVFYARQVSF